MQLLRASNFKRDNYWVGVSSWMCSHSPAAQAGCRVSAVARGWARCPWQAPAFGRRRSAGRLRLSRSRRGRAARSLAGLRLSGESGRGPHSLPPREAGRLRPESPRTRAACRDSTHEHANCHRDAGHWHWQVESESRVCEWPVASFPGSAVSLSAPGAGTHAVIDFYNLRHINNERTLHKCWLKTMGPSRLKCAEPGG